MLTSDNFEKLSWHDNAIHGLRILEGDDDTCGKLLLDIDYIAEWLQGSDKNFNFKIVPSDLTFYGVSGLAVSVDYAAATAAVQPMTIHEIIREVVTYPNGYSSYSWKIEINWPPKGFISFQATGFTQVPRMEPVVSGAQYLSPSERGS